MRLIRTKEDDLEENYLELHYSRIDEETAAIIKQLKEGPLYIEGSCDGRKLTVALQDIYYMETVDRKTFAYTKDTCIEIREALRDVIDEFSDAGFVRISKSAIVNINKVRRLQGDLNMRVMIYLKNDERLVMNRSYRNDFYAKLESLQGRKKK